MSISRVCYLPEWEVAPFSIDSDPADEGGIRVVGIYRIWVLFNLVMESQFMLDGSLVSALL